MPDEDEKECPVDKHGCGEIKALSKFHRNPRNKDGRAHICGECTNTRNHEQQTERKKQQRDKVTVDRLFYKFCGVDNPDVALKMVEHERSKKNKS